MNNNTFGSNSMNSHCTFGVDLSFWYAVYTSAHHEKKVAEQFAGREIEHFLPLYEAVHQWKDRRVRLQLPLFPGYVFVRLRSTERPRALQVPGVARLVGFGDRPAPIPDLEIDGLRRGLQSQLKMQPHPYLTEGRKVRIIRGPLAGIEGILVRQKQNFRVVLSLDLIMRSVVVEVDTSDVYPIFTGEPLEVRQLC